jgi:hypothetical protein
MDILSSMNEVLNVNQLIALEDSLKKGNEAKIGSTLVVFMNNINIKSWTVHFKAEDEDNSLAPGFSNLRSGLSDLKGLYQFLSYLESTNSGMFPNSIVGTTNKKFAQILQKLKLVDIPDLEDKDDDESIDINIRDITNFMININRVSSR